MQNVSQPCCEAVCQHLQHLQKSTQLHVDHMFQVADHMLQITDSLNRLERAQGEMVERQLRGDLKNQFGDQYSKRLLARCIMDFAPLFKDRAMQPRLNNVADRAALLMPAIQVCCKFMLCTALKAQTRYVACFVHCTESTHRDTVACTPCRYLSTQRR